MKRKMFLVLMLTGSVLLLSAEGKKDEDTQFYGRGPGMMGGGYGYNADDYAKLQQQREADLQAYLDTLETVSVTGSLSLVDGQLPVVDQGGSKYVFMAPWDDLAKMNLKDGMNVTVEGYKMPGRPLQWDDNEVYVMVTKAVIDGKDYEVDHDMDGYGMMGGFGGRGGNSRGFAGNGGYGMGRRF